MNYLQLTLDISKTSTGITLSHISVQGKNVQTLAMVSGAVREPANSAYLTKNYHISVRGLLNQISSIVASFCNEHKIPADISKWCIYEYPIFDKNSTALQYYLHQSVQEYLDLNNFESIGISTGLVKSYANSLKNEVRTSKETTKAVMKELYAFAEAEKLLPYGYTKASQTNSSDEVDALFISLIGLHLVCPLLEQQKILEDRIFEYVTDLKITPENIQHFSEVWREILLGSRTKPVSPVEWTYSNRYAEVHKATVSKLRANKALSCTGSKLTHPYATMRRVSKRIQDHINAQSPDYKANYSRILSPKIKFSIAGKEDYIKNGNLSLQLDHQGCLHAVSEYSAKLNVTV